MKPPFETEEIISGRTKSSSFRALGGFTTERRRTPAIRSRCKQSRIPSLRGKGESMFSERVKEVVRGVTREIREAGTWKEERLIASPQGVEILVNGRKVLNFCANNY